ncbi:MAG: sigma factor-like helix-turn-helix DNA-binding protein [Phycisphaerales bacterium]|nr:sigma factor-like helix-turn-helix DNA-binding protein [Phycisphaerales bacterium]
MPHRAAGAQVPVLGSYRAHPSQPAPSCRSSAPASGKTRPGVEPEARGATFDGCERLPVRQHDRAHAPGRAGLARSHRPPRRVGPRASPDRPRPLGPRGVRSPLPPPLPACAGLSRPPDRRPARRGGPCRPDLHRRVAGARTLPAHWRPIRGVAAPHRDERDPPLAQASGQEGPARAGRAIARGRVRAASDREELRRAMRTLPAAQQDAIALVYFESMSIEQAAGVLGVRPGTVKSRLARAREALAHELRRRGVNQ